MEMYARKIALLQVLKYMPQSVEVQRAMDVATAVDSGKNFTFDGEVVVVNDDDAQGDQGGQSGSSQNLPICSSESFDKKKDGWRKAIINGTKNVKDLIATIETKELLTPDQKLTIDSWAHEND